MFFVLEISSFRHVLNYSHLSPKSIRLLWRRAELVTPMAILRKMGLSQSVEFKWGIRVKHTRPALIQNVMQSRAAHENEVRMVDTQPRMTERIRTFVGNIEIRWEEQLLRISSVTLLSQEGSKDRPLSFASLFLHSLASLRLRSHIFLIQNGIHNKKWNAKTAGAKKC